MKQEERIKGLETQVGNIREQLGNIEGRLSKDKSPNAVLIAVLSIFGAACIGFAGWVANRVVDQGNKIAAIYAVLGPDLLKQASQNPSNPNNIRQAQRVLETAQNKGEQIDAKVVATSGQKFIEAAKDSSTAWDTALVFLDYRSFLNAFLPTLPRGLTPPPAGHYGWEFEIVAAETNKEDGLISLDSAHMVPKSEAAALERLDNPLNSDKQLGPLYMMFTKIPVKLDGMHIQNVIFKDAKIVYDGGPLQMKNVYFVNCTFRIVRKPTGLEFAEKMLGAEAVTFSAA